MPPRKDKNRVPREKRALPATPRKDAERVAKVIARAGLGSRREVEDWIAEGRVAVNGTVLESPAVTVTAADAITVDGAPLPERERTRLFLYHKPRGVVTTNRDPEGRATLFELLPGGLPRLVSVGRLDLNSEGLLLLTNDGGLARALELPETGWLRRYRVRAHGAIDQVRLDTLIRGITVDGVEYGPIEAELDRVQGANVWLTVSLREGKNREVRNVLGALGLTVGRLIRVSYGPFQLGELAEGDVEEVKTRILRDQIGAELTAVANADFEGPILEHAVEEPPARPAPRRTAGRKGEDEAPEAPRRPARGRASAAAEAPAFEPPQKPRGPRRRLGETHDLESRGTVADRKGRTVKVERVVASGADEAEAPARGLRGSRGAPARGTGPGRGAPSRTAEGPARKGPRSSSGGPRGRGRPEAEGWAEDAPRPAARGPRGPRRAASEEGFSRADRPWSDEGPGAPRARPGERPSRAAPSRTRRDRTEEDAPPRPARSGRGRPEDAGPRGRPPREEEGRGAPSSGARAPRGARRDQDEGGGRPPRGGGRGFPDRERPPARGGAEGFDGPRGPRSAGKGPAGARTGTRTGFGRKEAEGSFGPRGERGGERGFSGGRGPDAKPGPRGPGAKGPGPKGSGAKGPGSRGPGAKGPGSKGPGFKGPGGKGGPRPPRGSGGPAGGRGGRGPAR